jgi:5'-3' exonuclease
MRIALIDTDIICFKAVSINEYNTYECEGKTYRYKRDIPKVDSGRLSACGQFPVMEYKKFTTVKVTGTLENVIKITEELLQAVLRNTEADAYICYLTPSRTFRHDVAVTLPYKGDREGKERPTYLKEVREYIESEHDGIYGNYIEADDCMAIAQAHWLNTNDIQTVICSSDKDLMMCEGWHYNLTSKVETIVTKQQGYITYARQILTGDKSVDNIQGIHGIGKKKAAKLIPDDEDEDEVQYILEEQYQKAYGFDFITRLEEVHQLIYMRTTPYYEHDKTDYFKYKLCEKQYVMGEF